MENKNPSSPTLKAGGTSMLLRKKGGNTVCRDHDQVSLLEGHNTSLLLCYGREKCCDKGSAVRLDTIMAHSIYSRIFNKQQQKILKEALEECKERL